MMKKLLVMLTMLAAISNAVVLELSIDGVTNGADNDQAITLYASDTAMIDVYCSADLAYAGWWIGISGPGSLAGTGTIYSPPGPKGTVTDYYGDGTWYKFVDSPEVVALALGKWWDEEFHCDGEGLVTLTLYDSGGVNPLDTITITQLPEPVTIALLGLGGLFLRRRK
jgi:hypothetical protein